MKPAVFKITKKQLNHLLKNSKDGKNSDIGNLAIEVVKLYFQSIDALATFENGTNGVDLVLFSKGKKINYEVKGTQDDKIAFGKLKVSSQKSHDALVAGMELIRVTNLRAQEMKIHFLKHGEDFRLEAEPRWAIKPIKKAKKA